MNTPQPIILDENLVEEARELGVEVQNVLEQELRYRIMKKKAALRWAEENRTFIDEHNARIERDGLWYERFFRDA